MKVGQTARKLLMQSLTKADTQDEERRRDNGKRLDQVPGERVSGVLLPKPGRGPGSTG